MIKPTLLRYAIVTAVAGMALVTTSATANARDALEERPLTTTPNFDDGNVTDLQPGPHHSVFIGGIGGFPGLYQVQGDSILWRIEPLHVGVNGMAYAWDDLIVASGSDVIRYDPPSTTPVWKVDLGKKVNDVNWVNVNGHTRILAGGDFAGHFKLLGSGGNIKTYGFPSMSGTINEFAGPTGTARMTPDPTHKRVAVIGNFRRIGGHSRKQAFTMGLGARHAFLQKWYIPDLRNDCAARAPVYLRDIEFSHDGKKILLLGKGGAIQKAHHLCDSVILASANPHDSSAPYLRSRTCVDSLMGGGFSPDDSSVLISGHMKNMERVPGGRPCFADRSDYPARFGMAMLRTSDMHLRGWRSDKCRAMGGLAVEWVHSGAWVGYDCGFWGNSEHRNPNPTPQFERARLAFLPAV